jgi:hypothetical protein
MSRTSSLPRVRGLMTEIDRPPHHNIRTIGHGHVVVKQRMSLRQDPRWIRHVKHHWNIAIRSADSSAAAVA